MIYENKESALKSREKFIYFKDENSDEISENIYPYSADKIKAIIRNYKLRMIL